ncbi:hypothetical protein KIV41_00825 [Vibrio sp. D401a]|nr:hypothetical protein [Vibrio sp. D401a]MDK9807764.1 hypothetical protein [Vibrio sp. D406a]
MVFSRPISLFYPYTTIGNKVIHKLQRQWYVWPEQSQFEPKTVENARQWDKVIGLVPQSVCLFKVFYYQTELIPQSEIRQCVDNELEQLVDWQEYQCHTWINKVQDRWQVAVWFWDKSEISFAQPVTHIVPAMACELAKVNTPEGILLYTEGQNTSAQSWAITWQGGKVIEQLYPMRSPLHQRTVAQRISEQQHVYSNQDHHSLLQGVELASLNLVPRSAVLSEGKCSNQFDLDNPWQYWRTLLALLLVLLAYMGADATLVSFKQGQIEDEITQLQQETFQLQRLRGEAQDTSKVLTQIELAQLRQRVPVQIIEALTTQLAKDVVIERLTYKPERIVLQGTIRDSLGLLETLSSLKGVKEARLLGEVVPVDDDRQEFRAELILLEADQWKN